MIKSLPESLIGIDQANLPRSVAIIMDGNGRWAVERGMERVAGHLRGVEVVRTIVEECTQLGLDCLTLYCFSSENWKRPKPELDFLMALLKQYLIDERPRILQQNLKFRTIGRREGLSKEVLEEIDETTKLAANNTGMTLSLAINYGGRQELVDAVKRIVDQVGSNQLSTDEISEHTIDRALDTTGLPDPDLLIRTAGEMRISNFLLWQISYAELWVTKSCWPDFTPAHLHEAFVDYSKRQRRFGGLILSS
jgi:undecaprenyl diphosphate synthase